MHRSWRLPATAGLITLLLALGLVLYERAYSGPWGLCGLDGLPLGSVTEQYMQHRAESHLFIQVPAFCIRTAQAPDRPELWG